jgi:vancomycin resistance protein YoaR
MRKVKHNTTPPRFQKLQQLFGWLHAGFLVTLLVILFALIAGVLFEKIYQGRIYPRVSVGNIDVGGKSPKEVETYWLAKNTPFAAMQFELRYDGKTATISGADLGLGYDATLSATQAYLVGRSRQWLTNIYIKLFQKPVNLAPYFRWNSRVVNDMLDTIASQVDIPATDALFRFQNGRVTSFRPSSNGRRLNKDEANARLSLAFYTAEHTGQQRMTILMPIEAVKPSVATTQANTFGIKENIGSGYSEFAGSATGRIHNIALAASRINGILVKPGETFSFNDAVGDISAATGYQSAYIIKEGRTVLGDGGGVCQVSTTLFRAALAAGLPVVERYAHAYRVHYYEEGGFKPGLDATVYGPTYDLKFKNDTPASILIQTKTDLTNLSLTFDLYGTSDGRKAQISNQKLWDITPPPPDLYQDDPTLPKGTVKQVDFSAWGAKASFDYTVTRAADVLQKTTFFSNFRPWQAVYLKGTL